MPCWNWWSPFTSTLDESVATWSVAASQQGWRGMVIGNAIAGSPASRLRCFGREHEIDATAFETAIGRQAALKLAVELFSHNKR